MILFGWGWRSLTRRIDANHAIVRRYRVVHAFYFLTFAWGGRYTLATRTEGGVNQQEIGKAEARAALGGKLPHPRLWTRFSLPAFLVILVGSGVILATVQSPAPLEIKPGTEQAWVAYFDRAEPAIEQFNALSVATETPGVVKTALHLLSSLEGSPDGGLNHEIGSEIDLCRSDSSACDDAIDGALRAYNNALDVAGRAGLVTVAPAVLPPTS